MSFTNKIYFTYRKVWDNRTNCYDVSYYNDKQYKDYLDAGLTEMIDGDRFIPSSRITDETAPGVKNLRRAGVLKHNVPPQHEELKTSLGNVAKVFALELKTIEEMRQWIRDNTDLEEDVETPGKFLVEAAHTNDIGEEVPDRYLIID